VKKVLVSIIIGLFAALSGLTCFAQDVIETVQDGSLYYSPSANTWSRTAKADDAITISKSGAVYKPENSDAFTLKSDYAFISKNKFAAVNNSNLKVYTAVYKDGKFTPSEMSAQQVQAMFDDVKVLAVSKMQNDMITVKRTPFTTSTCMIVNDTNADFTDYIFSPTSVQRSPIKGMFLVRQVGKIKFVKNGDMQKKYPYLQIFIRNDAEKYNSAPIYIHKPVVNYKYN